MSAALFQLCCAAMKTEPMPLHSEAVPEVGAGNKRNLAGLPGINLQRGVIFQPAGACQLTHSVLCVTVCRDSREENTLTLSIGPEFFKARDVSFVSAGQRLRIPLPPEATVLLNRFDLEVHTTEALWVCAANERYPLLAPTLSSSQQAPDFNARLCDSAVAPFGWMAGCVYDGLYHMHAVTGEERYRQGLDKHLGNFLQDNAVDYENPRSEIAHNEFHSIELTLPFAVIARLYPDHPAIDHALDFLRSRRRDDGLMYDGASITAEGCYTIAYPLMLIGTRRGDQELIDWAWQQQSIRRQALWQDGHLYLRNYDGDKSYADWARGICWYLLGNVRTWLASGEEPDTAARVHLQELSDWLLAQQNPQGLWYNFLEERDKPVDTSGSSGIAAALALAAQNGWVDRAALDAASRCWNGLQEHLVDGGFLDSVAPNNKRGETFQRSPQRSCEPLAMGLMAQLEAALVQAGLAVS